MRAITPLPALVCQHWSLLALAQETQELCARVGAALRQRHSGSAAAAGWTGLYLLGWSPSAAAVRPQPALQANTSAELSHIWSGVRQRSAGLL